MNDYAWDRAEDIVFILCITAAIIVWLLKRSWR